MSHGSPPERDAGLQHERTSLATTRTALSFSGAAVVLVHIESPRLALTVPLMALALVNLVLALAGGRGEARFGTGVRNAALSATAVMLALAAVYLLVNQ